VSEEQHGGRDTGNRDTTGDRDRDMPPPMTVTLEARLTSTPAVPSSPSHPRWI
jgi:hypothetical protein